MQLYLFAFNLNNFFFKVENGPVLCLVLLLESHEMEVFAIKYSETSIFGKNRPKMERSLIGGLCYRFSTLICNDF